MDHLELSFGVILNPDYFSTSAKFGADDDFFAFPNKPEYRWNGATGMLRGLPPLSINEFLQQWLFFGLLQTVLQDRTFKENDFITHGTTSRTIHTKMLTRYLEAWERTVSNDNNGMTMRMIKAQLALDKAREVVTTLYSMNWADWGSGHNPPREPDKKLILSLMVLGETLTNAKCQIVERKGFTIRGWHGDANEGWGIPSVVVNYMINKGWCVRTIYVLTCQLRSHVRNYKNASFDEHC